ncbi:MAG: carbon starvation protein A [Butyrivibrio sp.]|nr:carbon starvation protein A [Butyrivibrio sp.]
MITFIVSIIILFIGYTLYSRLTEAVFHPVGWMTPAMEHSDGVDIVPMKTWKAFLIQLLNIAGTGPIFGALMGACFGPVVFLWIVFGAILGGAVHDYMCGMISARNNGASIAALSGLYIGEGAMYLMRVFSVLLLLLTGTVFVTSPAALLNTLTGGRLGSAFWIIVILIYYVLATLLPIDKIIGRFYPIFGVVLIVMAISISAAMLVLPQYRIPELVLENLHPENLPVFPFMFITVACGAISGFHATQCPIVAKCIVSVKDGRRVFYGAMIAESVIALVWAAAGMAFYGDTAQLQLGLSSIGQSGVVYNISKTMLGQVGGILAIIGVVVCPITSGDTAFRSARLILAEWTGFDQKNLGKRLIITIPLLAAGALLTQLDFNVLWRYFSWSNQTLATIALWVATVYLLKSERNRIGSLITALPAVFMTAVVTTYIIMADEGLRLPGTVAYPVGIILAGVLLVLYLTTCVIEKKHEKK